MFEFDFERLDVYKASIEYFRLILRVARIFPREIQYSIGDQIRRAALSISNNIAEGSGKESKREKKYFYSIAKHSCRECIPMLTILKEEKIIEIDTHNNLREFCVRITSMLTRLNDSLRG